MIFSLELISWSTDLSTRKYAAAASLAMLDTKHCQGTLFNTQQRRDNKKHFLRCFFRSFHSFPLSGIYLDNRSFSDNNYIHLNTGVSQEIPAPGAEGCCKVKMNAHWSSVNIFKVWKAQYLEVQKNLELTSQLWLSSLVKILQFWHWGKYLWVKDWNLYLSPALLRVFLKDISSQTCHKVTQKHFSLKIPRSAQLLVSCRIWDQCQIIFKIVTHSPAASQYHHGALQAIIKLNKN